MPEQCVQLIDDFRPVRVVLDPLLEETGLVGFPKRGVGQLDLRLQGPVFCDKLLNGAGIIGKPQLGKKCLQAVFRSVHGVHLRGTGT